jgi:hypothetical protein
VTISLAIAGLIALTPADSEARIQSVVRVMLRRDGERSFGVPASASLGNAVQSICTETEPGLTFAAGLVSASQRTDGLFDQGWPDAASRRSHSGHTALEGRVRRAYIDSSVDGVGVESAEAGPEYGFLPPRCEPCAGREICGGTANDDHAPN